MKFDIGTYAWPAQIAGCTPCLIIGRHLDLIVLKIESPFNFLNKYYGRIRYCDKVDCDLYRINTEYIGAEILPIHIQYIAYLGKTCKLCQSLFDFLPPENILENDFICWNCEVRNLK